MDAAARGHQAGGRAGFALAAPMIRMPSVVCNSGDPSEGTYGRLSFEYWLSPPRSSGRQPTRRIVTTTSPRTRFALKPIQQVQGATWA